MERSRSIAALPSDLRVPLVLHYREGLKYREIAEVCGCSEGMVARRLHLAKSRFRRRLGRKSAREQGREKGPEKGREKKLGGATLLGAGGFEATLRADAPVEVPAGLEGRLCESIERELAVAARTAMRAPSTAKSAWVSHDNRRVAAAQKLFEEALQSQNLAWEAFGGRNWVFPAR